MAYPLMLEGKVALVTGASRGIGAAIARAFAKAGAKVVLTARHKDALNELATQLHNDHGTETLVFVGDVTDAGSVQELYRQIFEKFGKLDVLAANAGILVDGMLGMFRPDDIHRILDVNVAGMINHLQAAPRLMRRQKSGSIIITSSIIGRVGNKGQAIYGASKGALISLAQSAAKELGPEGIRVNAIAPGFIETDMTKHIPADIRKQRLDNIALNRTGTPEEVADVVLFLASDLSRYVSGQIIGVDGCMVI